VGGEARARNCVAKYVDEAIKLRLLFLTMESSTEGRDTGTNGTAPTGTTGGSTQVLSSLTTLLSEKDALGVCDVDGYCH
jgi:hypothetical protein